MELVEVVLRETIKPSSPTPPNKKTFKLSLLDQLVPISSIYYTKSMVYYASAQTKNFENLDDTLKESLSEALTIFYPFAGRLDEDDRTIGCSDNGVLFVTASVGCKLADFLADPNPKIDTVDQFLPSLPAFCPDQSDKPALAIFQLNKFTCGGIALSYCLNHMLADGITKTTFLKCWSDIAAKVRSAKDYSILPPVLMSPKGSEKIPSNLSSLLWDKARRAGSGTMKRFVFEDWALLKLKEDAKSEHLPNPSRTEALMGFIWKNLMEASEIVWGYKQPSRLFQPIDLRRRVQLEITPKTLPIGNMIWKAVAHYLPTTAAKNEDDIAEKDLVWQIRQSFNRVKDVFVPKLLNDGAYDTIIKSFEEVEETKLDDENLNAYATSSLNKAGLRDIDFGWGKPIWVSYVGETDFDAKKNYFLLIDGALDSIEAWIILDKREMQVLENNPKFLAFALPNPPIFVDSI